MKSPTRGLLQSNVPASPLETLLEFMAANGLEQKDIAEILGSRV
jgi:antitoxin component HigA of HigAB toxin-antitoxin module